MIQRSVPPACHFLRGGLLLYALLLAANAAGGEKNPATPLPDASLTPATAQLSPDGKLFASGDREILISDAATGRVLHRLPHDRYIEALAFSPDGRLLAAASDRGIRLWVVASGKPHTRLEGEHREDVHAVAFSPAGTLLASGDLAGVILLWDLTKGKPRRLEPHKGPIRSLAFSPSGKLLASCGHDQIIRVSEVMTGREVLTIRGSGSLGPQRVAFAADGQTLFWTEALQPSVHRFSLAAGKSIGRLDLLRLEVTPHGALLEDGATTPLRVVAHWSDGRAQDVTSRARYEVRDGEIFTVTPLGRVQAHRPGRTIVAAQYLGRTTAAIVTVRDAKSGAFPDLPAHNFVDKLLLAEWKKAGFRLAEPLNDALFLRRAYLHLLGTLPTSEELRQFEARKDPDKRRKVIDELLDRPEYADYWGVMWARLLGVGEWVKSEAGRSRAHLWLRQHLAQNTSASRIVRELLLAEGKLAENGATALAAANPTPEQLAQTVAQAFLGVDLRCARCHKHPEGAWGPDDYRGLAACFSEVSVEGKGNLVVRIVPGRTLLDPVSGKAVLARASGEPAFPAAQRDPRRALADWLTRANNPTLARNLVNRYWAHFYGEGLVEPLDALHEANPSLHPALLDALTKDFLAHGCDVKHLVRVLCQARAYHLGIDSAPPANASLGAAALFARRRPVRVTEEARDRIIAVACGLEPPTAAKLLSPRYQHGPFALRHHEERADGLCERYPPTPRHALMLLGGEEFMRLISHPKGRIARLVQGGASDDQVMDDLFLVTLSRLPTADERKRVREHISSQTKAGKPRVEPLRDILWALLNTKAFYFYP